MRGHRRLPEAQKRRDDARERDHPERAPGDEEHLKEEEERHAEPEEEAVHAPRAKGDVEGAVDEHGIEREDRHEAEEPELFAEGGEHHVRVRRGDVARVSEAEALPGEAARRHGPEGVREVVAAPREVLPRREEHLDALGHHRHGARAVGVPEDGGERGEAEAHGGPAVARDAVEHEERAGDDERRPHVAEGEEDEHRPEDAHDDGQRVAHAREVEPVERARQETGEEGWEDISLEELLRRALRSLA